MLTEYIRYTVPPDRAAALIDAYGSAGESLKASVHCLGFDLTRCAEAPESFILRISWDSLDGHLQGFRKSSEFRRFFEAIRPFVENIQEMRHYEATPVRWERATPA